MEYYSALKRNGLSNYEKTWRKLKCLLLSEKSQSEKATYFGIPTIRPPGKGKAVKIVPASWEICLQVKKKQLELDMEQQTGSKLGME